MSVNMNIDSKIDMIFDNFKKVSPALIAITIATGLILFLPDSILKRMALDKLPDLWKNIIGIIFIISVALIITIALIEFYKKITVKIKTKIVIRKLRKRYLGLSKSQQSLLKKVLNSKEKSCKLDPTSGDVIYLKEYDFLYQADKHIFFGPGYTEPVTFTPQPWLFDLYNKEPDLFK